MFGYFSGLVVDSACSCFRNVWYVDESLPFFAFLSSSMNPCSARNSKMKAALISSNLTCRVSSSRMYHSPFSKCDKTMHVSFVMPSRGKALLFIRLVISPWRVAR